MTFERELVVLLTKPSMFGKQNNQLPAKSHDELKDINSNSHHIPRHANIEVFPSSTNSITLISFRSSYINNADPLND